MEFLVSLSSKNVKFKIHYFCVSILHKNYSFIASLIEYHSAKEGSNYPPDATIEARKFVIKDFVVGSSIAIFGSVTADGTKVKVIHREHDAAIHALSAHPSL